VCSTATAKITVAAISMNPGPEPFMGQNGADLAATEQFGATTWGATPPAIS
jgi:hypothetical protein